MSWLAAASPSSCSSSSKINENLSCLSLPMGSQFSTLEIDF
jgi:hypothetical protein